MSSVREWGDCEHGIRIHKCPECALSELTTLRARIAELEKRVAAKGQEVVDVLNNAERYYADFRSRIAELEREKGELAATVEARTCRHGWRGLSCEAHQQIANRCPACKGQLFIASKGWLTCANLKCHEPGAAGDAIDAAMQQPD